MPNNITLLVTGSIAAIKTTSLLNCLQASGHSISVIITQTPIRWEWVSLETLKRTKNVRILGPQDSEALKQEVMDLSALILVAPASADFTSRLAHRSSTIAKSVLHAHQCGSKLCVAPAMNFKMWHHPAVQRNFASLASAGITVLGPVHGDMACGDKGFGRMLDVAMIGNAVDSILADRSHPALYFYKVAMHETFKTRPTNPARGTMHLLIVLSGKKRDWSTLKKMSDAMQQSGMTADYVADQSWVADHTKLETIIQQSVITDHFQLSEFNGMEHIRLPERASSVFFPFIDDHTAQKCLRGEADTLSSSIYLASKTPIVTTHETLNRLEPSQASQLRRDGITVVENYRHLITAAQRLGLPTLTH